MANGINKQPRTIALWGGRPVVVINESEGREVHFHGVMIGPTGMDYETALNFLDQAFADAVAKGGEEWNYDDVISEMKDAGFEEVLAAVWDEENADYPEEDDDEDEPNLIVGQRIWVHDKATDKWHSATFAGHPITNDDGPLVYGLSDCPIKWCHGEDISESPADRRKHAGPRKEGVKSRPVPDR